MTPELTFHLASIDQLGLVNRFYKNHRHKGKCGHEDLVYFARSPLQPGSKEAPVVAAVRFTFKNNAWLLRGLWVAANLRRQGFGGQLLTYTTAQMHEPVWCYPYEHLHDFYCRHGFQEQPSTEAPLWIARQWQSYRDKGETFPLMGFMPSTS